MYIYGMRLRGFSLGAQPMRGLVDAFDDKDGKYYSILCYNRLLSNKELSDYELDFIGEENIR